MARSKITVALGIILTILGGVRSTPADQLDQAIAVSQSRDRAPLISRRTLLRRPERVAYLSLDGDSIAYRVRSGNIYQVRLFDVPTNVDRLLFSTKSRPRLFWSRDSQHIFIKTDQDVSVVGLAESAYPEWLINIDDANRSVFFRVDYTQPHAVLVTMRSDDRKSHVLYRVHADGSRVELYRSEERVESVLLDEHGKLSFIKRRTDSGNEIVCLLEDRRGVVITCPRSPIDPCELVDFHNDTLYLRARFDGDLASLYQVDVRTGKPTLMHADPKRQVDLSGVISHPRHGPWMTVYRDDYTSWYGLTKEVSDAIKAIEESIESPNLLLQPDAVHRRWLIHDLNPARATTTVSLYDSVDGSVAHPLEVSAKESGAQEASLADEHVAITVAVRYRVSDGMMQQGYLTLPSGYELSQIPLIVYPHGGPFVRVYGDFGLLAQFLANRGYAVFRPNFRASDGFGRHYAMCANYDFGDGRVQQDIIDGTEYVLSRGIGHRDKLGIVGHSFGGFSTLCALAFTPKFFQVGVAGAPAIDLTKTLETFAKDEARKEGFRLLKAMFGDPDDLEAMARLRTKSPDTHACRVERPLYIWAGRKDDRVSILNVRDYALRQRQAGKAVVLMEDAVSGHSAREGIPREAYYYLFEKALGDHLGGRMETAISPELERFLKRSIVIGKNRIYSEVDALR